MIKKFGIIGNPISHSLSPVLHNYWFKKYSIDSKLFNICFWKFNMQEYNFQKYPYGTFKNCTFQVIRYKLKISILQYELNRGVNDIIRFYKICCCNF